jgi:hypothetical protein
VNFYDSAYVTSGGGGGVTGGGGTGGGVVVAVTPAQASSFVAVGFPSTTTAGSVGSFAITTKDPYGNVATGYTGTVHFSSTDPQARLPADYTFVPTDNGYHNFSIALDTAGVQAITVIDTANASLSVTKNGITVNAAAASSLAVTGFPTPTTLGSVSSFTVTALDPYGNAANGYTATVHFSSSDASASLPRDYTFTAADAGVHTFSAAMNTVGLQSLTATDSATTSVTGSESSIYVVSGASSLNVTGFPDTATAGSVCSVTVTALDAAGNLLPGYLGTVHFSSRDPQAVLPADYSFTAADQGVHTFSVALLSAGTQSLTASESLTPAITGSQSGILVTAAAASGLVVSGFPASVIAGTPGSVTVTAVDSYGNFAADYTGTVHFSSGDPLAQLPADYTFTAADQGVHVVQATLCRSHFESITATDVATSSITGSQTGIEVNPAQATQIPMAYPVYPQAGQAFVLIVNIMDNYGNVITDWTGTVHFQSSDPNAELPADYTFAAADQGTHRFDVTLWTLGDQTVQVSDAAGVLYSWPMYMTVVS